MKRDGVDCCAVCAEEQRIMGPGNGFCRPESDSILELDPYCTEPGSENRAAVGWKRAAPVLVCLLAGRIFQSLP